MQLSPTATPIGPTTGKFASGLRVKFQQGDEGNHMSNMETIGRINDGWHILGLTNLHMQSLDASCFNNVWNRSPNMHCCDTSTI